MARVIDCPKCGVSQPADVFCASCGVRIDAFKRQDTSSRSRQTLLIALIAVILMGIGLKWVKSGLEKTLTFKQEKEGFNLESDTRPAPSPVSNSPYQRRAQTESAQQASAQPEFQTTAAETPQAVKPAPLTSVNVYLIRFDPRVLARLQFLRTEFEQGDAAMIVFQNRAMQLISQLGAESAGERQVNLPGRFSEQLAAATQTQEADGLFLNLGRSTTDEVGFMMEGEARIASLFQAGYRATFRKNVVLAANETALMFGLFPHEPVRANAQISASSPFAMFKDPQYQAHAMDLGIIFEAATPAAAAAPAQ